MYKDETGLYFCDRCGAVIDGDPTVVDWNDYGANVNCEPLEGVELCPCCYDRFMAEQAEVCNRLYKELRFNWRKDIEIEEKMEEK